MLKTVVAKRWTHVSVFGSAEFSRVRIVVEADFPGRRGQILSIREDDPRVAGLDGEVIHQMEREVAKRWILDFAKQNRALSSLKPREIQAMRWTLGINQSDFAKLLGVSKGSITKYMKGSLKPTAPVATLMLIFLAAELTKEGTAKEVLRHRKTLVTGLNLTVPPPRFDLSAA